ncbi:PTS N-acetylmuramic acid transporter subunit IIBC [Thorsellia kenyensis]|uniref:PTS N-acetylmuramic acid transporter subunit IIBC n=1 Tax=Thorsellia kenyensis TaxID=1549888 RepID=A0ABV6C867_9GAMM
MTSSGVKKVDNVLGLIEADGQLQIVLGPGKAQTAAEMMRSILENDSSANVGRIDLQTIAAAQKNSIKAKQTNPIQKFFATFATIFTPLIPGFIAAGLLAAIGTLLHETLIKNNENPVQTIVDLIAFLKVFSAGLFGFMSILIGYNAQKAFGGTGVNGAIIATLFVFVYTKDPTGKMFSGMENFFGLAIDPRGNVIGVLIAAILGAFVEKKVRKFIPDNLDMILTSTITLLIMGALTFTIIMPAGKILFDKMSWLFLTLNGNPIGASILAGLFLISVMFGIHQGFVPVYYALVETQGFNSLFPILAMAGAGQVGAAIALYTRAAKQSVLRKQISGAIIPGILGIGEPLIYGVTLPRVKPFITACLGGAVGGFYIGLIAYLGTPMGLNSVFGPSGVIALPFMTTANSAVTGILIYGSGLIVAYVAGYILTYLFGSKNVDLN